MNHHAVPSVQDLLDARAQAGEPAWWRPPVPGVEPEPALQVVPDAPPPVELGALDAPAQPAPELPAWTPEPTALPEPTAPARLLHRIRGLGVSRVLVLVGVAGVGAAWLWAGGSSSVFGSEQDAVDCAAALALIAGGLGAVVLAVRGVIVGGREEA